jgi:hypothetical protein
MLQWCSTQLPQLCTTTAAAAVAAANQSRDLASRQGDACDLMHYLASDQDVDSTL